MGGTSSGTTSDGVAAAENRIPESKCWVCGGAGGAMRAPRFVVEGRGPRSGRAAAPRAPTCEADSLGLSEYVLAVPTRLSETVEAGTGEGEEASRSVPVGSAKTGGGGAKCSWSAGGVMKGS